MMCPTNCAEAPGERSSPLLRHRRVAASRVIRSLSRISSIFSIVRFSCRSSFTSATGAVSHEPRHSRASSVMRPSSVVSCGSMSQLLPQMIEDGLVAAHLARDRLADAIDVPADGMRCGTPRRRRRCRARRRGRAPGTRRSRSSPGGGCTRTCPGRRGGWAGAPPWRLVPRQDLALELLLHLRREVRLVRAARSSCVADGLTIQAMNRSPLCQIIWWRFARLLLPIQLRRDDVQRAQHRDEVGEQVALEHLGERLVVDEGRRPVRSPATRACCRRRRCSKPSSPLGDSIAAVDLADRRVPAAVGHEDLEVLDRGLDRAVHVALGRECACLPSGYESIGPAGMSSMSWSMIFADCRISSSAHEVAAVAVAVGRDGHGELHRLGALAVPVVLRSRGRARPCAGRA